jgi:putative tryptophan/tyrosine transport system substrate-binding protein
MISRRTFTAGLGVAIVWLHTARAQQRAMPVVGLLSPTTAEYEASFRQGLADAGYVEGENVAIEYRRADGHYDRLPALAADLVARKVDVIATLGPPSALAAKRATSAIPIVFEVGSDPIALGLVASLARPGGNLTGVTFLTVELLPKLVQLLSELVPQVRVIAALVNPTNPNTERNMADLQEAARATGLQVHLIKAATEDEIDGAFATLMRLPAGALIVTGDPFFNSRREQLGALASRYAVPAIYPFREYAVADGLISYGASIAATHRRLGAYAAKILKGAKPGDLPVEQSTTFELVINLKAARALGLAVPQSLIARADEVIE